MLRLILIQSFFPLTKILLFSYKMWGAIFLIHFDILIFIKIFLF